MQSEKDLELQKHLLETYAYLTLREGSADHAAVNVPAENALEFARALHDVEGFTAVQDCSGCDWGVEASPRFSAMYHFYNYEKHLYVRVNVPAEDDKNPTVPSLCSVWAGCNWHEREAYDLMGITFKGHPDMRRILMWDAYPYHPLRKDFPLAGIEVPAPDADTVAQTGMKVLPAPMNGGPFVSGSGKTMRTSEPSGCDQEWREENRKK